MYDFVAGSERLDRDLVYGWLSGSYWAAGRTRAAQDAAIEGSRNYGVYERGSGRQVAYARVVTDGATFAWVCDVFVDESVRGRGIGKELMRGVMSDLDPLDLGRTLLATADAHGLYARHGFAVVTNPGAWMVKRGAGSFVPEQAQ